MQNLKIMNSREKKRILEMLNEQFGYGENEKMNYAFLFNEKEQKIFLVTPDVSKIDLGALHVNSIGVYFGQVYKGSIRLSIEGSQLIGNKASKNILELEESQRTSWLKGEDLDIKKDVKQASDAIEYNSLLDGFYLIKSGEDFIGTGKMTDSKLSNFVPKARRLSDIS